MGSQASCHCNRRRVQSHHAAKDKDGTLLAGQGQNCTSQIWGFLDWSVARGASFLGSIYGATEKQAWQLPGLQRETLPQVKNKGIGCGVFSKAIIPQKETAKGQDLRTPPLKKFADFRFAFWTWHS